MAQAYIYQLPITPQTRDFQPGTAVQVIYHTSEQTYHLKGIIREDPANAPGLLVALEEDPYSPATTARVYPAYEVWLEASQHSGRNTPLPGGYIRGTLPAYQTDNPERPVT